MNIVDQKFQNIKSENSDIKINENMDEKKNKTVGKQKLLIMQNQK